MTPSGTPRKRSAAGWRFLVVGGANTALTAGLLVVLSYVMPGWIAYTVSFGLGILFSTFFASRWVFTSAGSLRASVVYAASYIVIYLVGLACAVVLAVALFRAGAEAVTHAQQPGPLMNAATCVPAP